jgi:hypothetical protein
MARVPRLAMREEQISCSFEDFCAHHYQTFDGSQGCFAAESWIIDIQKLFEVLSYTDGQKVLSAAYKLIGLAARWWKTKKELLNRELRGVEISWAHFKKEFNDRFFPRVQQQLCAKEFHNLVQGNMTVELYGAKFMELARFALNLVLDEESRTERFQEGMHPRIRDRVTCLKIKDFTKLVNVAAIVERGHKDYEAIREKRKLFIPYATRPAKKLAVGSGSGQKAGKKGSANQGARRPTCPKCGKMHAGECRSGTGTCL